LRVLGGDSWKKRLIYLRLSSLLLINSLRSWLHSWLHNIADQSLLAGVNCQELYRETARVRLKIGVRLPDGSRPYLDPVSSAKRKLKPLFAFVDREPEHHPEGVYFLRYAREGKRIWEHSVRIGNSRLMPS
jgi:hypothetical protein